MPLPVGSTWIQTVTGIVVNPPVAGVGSMLRRSPHDEELLYSQVVMF